LATLQPGRLCDNIGRMKMSSLLVCIAIVLAMQAAVVAQTGGGHTLFGDLKVDESQVADSKKPQTFHMVLYNLGGRVLARQMITSNGRFRFFDVLNGEYDIVVELEGREVARLRIVLGEPAKTEIRHDIHLEWRNQPAAIPRGKVASISADEYKRNSANQSLFDQAQEAIRNKDYDKAIPLLVELTRSDSKDFVAWAELGSLHFRKDDAGEAERCYLRALEEKPAFYLALLNLGKVRLAQKNWDGSIEILSRAVTALPASADANYLLGEAYLQAKKGSKAVGYLNEALKLDPVGKAEAHLRLAALYNAAGWKEKAAQEYEQFLAKKPDYPQKKQLQQYIKENKKQ
jgi:tetratricopeptide (TPR) repeat protein